MSDKNPYAPPISPLPEPASDPAPIEFEPKDHRKIRALVSDANGFWLAIPMSILCYGCGAFALPIWYSMRLLQWQSLANKYPALLANGVPRGSLQAKFKAALWKLVLGIVVGGLLFLIIAIFFLVEYFNIMKRV